MENKDAPHGDSDEFQELKPKERYIVNPLALQNCFVRLGERTARVMDISHSRVVIEEDRQWPFIAENEQVALDFVLERQQFSALLVLKSRRQESIRFNFEKIVPSSQAHLRSFLSPRKIGESLIEDWRTIEIRHFHGLGECEMWFDTNGGVFFTLLDSREKLQQFIVRLTGQNAQLQTGKILRTDYIEMKSLDADLPLIPITDREAYSKLSDCRDIITNFRPTGQLEYALKQRLLKVISENLYSTVNRVELPLSRVSRGMGTQIDG